MTLCLCGCRVKKVCNFLGFASGGRALGKGAEYFVYELGCRASDNINQRLKLQRIAADKKLKAQEKAAAAAAAADAQEGQAAAAPEGQAAAADVAPANSEPVPPRARAAVPVSAPAPVPVPEEKTTKTAAAVQDETKQVARAAKKRDGFSAWTRQELLDYAIAKDQVSTLQHLATSRSGTKRHIDRWTEFFLTYCRHDADVTTKLLQAVLDSVKQSVHDGAAERTVVCDDREDGRKYRMCSYCWKYIERGADFHDVRNCPDRPMIIDADLLLKLAITLNWTKRTRLTLRRVLGRGVADNHTWIKNRQDHVDAMPKMYLSPGNRGVWSNVVECIVFLLSLPEVVKHMPEGEVEYLVTCLTMDGTNLHGKLMHRQLNAMLCRILNTGKFAQNLNGVFVISADEITESTQTMFQMFVNNLPFAKSFENHFANKYGFVKHMPTICADGAALSHMCGTGGHSCVFGCTFCTRHEHLKHVNHKLINSADKDSIMCLGEPRTFEKTQEWMHMMEEFVKEEMANNYEKYLKKCDGDKEILDGWCRPNLTHIKEHPANAKIIEYSRLFIYSTRSLPIFNGDNFTEQQVFFDLLHGELNLVNGQLIPLLCDLQVSNPELFLVSLRLAFSAYSYLDELRLPNGRSTSGNLEFDDDPTKKKKLDGNGCVQLLNAWPELMKVLFGDFSHEALKQHAAASIDAAALRAARDANEALLVLINAAKARATALASDRAERKIQDERHTVEDKCEQEIAAEARVKLLSQELKQLPADTGGGIVFEVGTNGVHHRVPAVRGIQRKEDYLLASRRNCFVALLLLGRHMAEALALSFTLEVKPGIDYEKEIICEFEKEMDAYLRCLVKNITSVNLGVTLNREGRELVNWPCHQMQAHVPEMMRFLWRTAGIVYGVTALKVTEKFNGVLKTAAVHTKRLRNMEMIADLEERLRQSQHYQIVRDARLLVVLKELEKHPDIRVEYVQRHRRKDAGT